jgi:hypothetical protein
MVGSFMELMMSSKMYDATIAPNVLQRYRLRPIFRGFGVFLTSKGVPTKRKVDAILKPNMILAIGVSFVVALPSGSADRLLPFHVFRAEDSRTKPLTGVL